MDQAVAWLLQEKYQGEKNPSFFSDCERLIAGEPLAYVIGHIPFLNCTIYLDSHPLIPRPETEFWVEKAIQTMKTTLPRKDLGKAPGILDLCAGSGCIGVAVAKAFPSAHLTFAELDPTHLPTIEKNCAVNSIKNHTTVKSDVFANVSGRFDCILSNPPYVDAALDRVAASVKANEPALALYGGQAGMELITRIITEAPALLKPLGELWLEHEPEQTPLIAILAETTGFSIVTYPDQYDTLRYSVLVLQ